MSELTAGQIAEFKNRGEEYRAQFKRSMTSGFVEFELFDGLLDSIDTLVAKLITAEKDTAKNCADIAQNSALLETVIGAQYTGGWNGGTMAAADFIRDHYSIGDQP